MMARAAEAIRCTRTAASGSPRRRASARRAGRPDPLIGGTGAAEREAMHETFGLETLLDVERRRTTER
jgi:hypothetical protein